jgi:hypothetical protein
MDFLFTQFYQSDIYIYTDLQVDRKVYGIYRLQGQMQECQVNVVVQYSLFILTFWNLVYGPLKFIEMCTFNANVYI